MKLYLSSIGIPNTAKFMPLFARKSSLSVAIIPNAWDVYLAERRDPEIKNLQKIFGGLGFDTTLVDLKVTTGEKLQSELARHSAVWVMGGNTFYLNYHVHKSGLAGFIKQLLNEGLVYGGESAGAVLATPTLHGVELLDDSKEAPEVIWNGLSLVDFGIVPHWGMEKYANRLKQCKDKMEAYTQTRTLTNDQALVIVDDKVNLISQA